MLVFINLTFLDSISWIQKDSDETPDL